MNLRWQTFQWCLFHSFLSCSCFAFVYPCRSLCRSIFFFASRSFLFFSLSRSYFHFFLKELKSWSALFYVWMNQFLVLLSPKLPLASSCRWANFESNSCFCYYSSNFVTCYSSLKEDSFLLRHFSASFEPFFCSFCACAMLYREKKMWIRSTFLTLLSVCQLTLESGFTFSFFVSSHTLSHRTGA